MCSAHITALPVHRTDLGSYAELFAGNHISGKRLFLLTDSDLLQIGVLSVGHRRELMVCVCVCVCVCVKGVRCRRVHVHVYNIF